jgi:hypothetical protein
MVAAGMGWLEVALLRVRFAEVWIRYSSRQDRRLWGIFERRIGRLAGIGKRNGPRV